ncbi:lipase 1-like [Ostrinia furnacalis]|uniref:lipase 1-like n=1 Tax=Ostrinia furnacalis TaxID=93504 RepID=UPI00103883E3|nr:lipase 1-like [Ostrinia furnacalis]
MYLRLLLFAVIAGDIFVHSQLSVLSGLEDAALTYTGLAAKYGHPATTYKVTTEDGYILTLFRHPGNTSRPVLLVHGNTPTSDCFIDRGKGSLAITLAGLGYDVWAINIRGTRYSRSHVTLNPDTQPKQFFNYSFYEEAVYDLSATIDRVLTETAQKKLTVVSHSVGTTLLYVLGSEKPEYNDKINVGISLAPIAFLKNVRGYAGIILPYLLEITSLFADLGIEEVFSYEKTGTLLRLICDAQPFGYEVCVKIVLFGALGVDSNGFEMAYTPTFFGHYPGGSTRKIFQHLGQVYKRDKFANFDYGEDKNLQLYGTSEPPDFDLSKVTMKTALFVGEEDYLGTVKDAERLNQSLPNVVYYQVMPYKNFSHTDFVWGRQMAQNLFPYLLPVIDKYT